jgi:RNA polymerase sigma-70 factor (ECF subfamily)
MTTTPLEALLEKLCSGDVTAAEQVFLAYEPYLRLVVRRMLPASLRRKFDSVDVVHSVWADLLHGFRESGWRFETVAHLRSFLLKATRNRFLDNVRRTRREVASERPVDLAAMQAGVGQGDRPSEIAQANDLWERMLQMCAEAHRPLLDLRRQGCTLEEIARQTGYHPGHVRRIFSDLARQLAAANQTETEETQAQ